MPVMGAKIKKCLQAWFSVISNTFLHFLSYGFDFLCGSVFWITTVEKTFWDLQCALRTQYFWKNQFSEVPRQSLRLFYKTDPWSKFFLWVKVMDRAILRCRGFIQYYTVLVLWAQMQNTFCHFLNNNSTALKTAISKKKIVWLKLFFNGE